MAADRIKLNDEGFRQLLTSPKVAAFLAQRAKRIADACGEGYESGATAGHTRARGYVVTASPAAERDNAQHNTLVRNLSAGR
jgi:hypothetical protein